MKLYFPQERMIVITKEVTTILNSPHQVSARQLVRMIGLLSATQMIGLLIQQFYHPAVLPAPLHYRNLQRTKEQLVSSGSYNSSCPLTKEAQLELKWWLQTLYRINGKTIKPNLTDMTIYTDASTWGWGARSGEITIGGDSSVM